MLAKFLNLPALPIAAHPPTGPTLRRPESSCDIDSKIRQYRRCHRPRPPLMLWRARTNSPKETGRSGGNV